MYQVSIFSMEQFRRYIGSKFFLFSNMAATPCDLWCHNYHKSILHEQSLLRWKFCEISMVKKKKTTCCPASIQPRFDRTPDPLRPLYQIKFRMGGRSHLWSFALIWYGFFCPTWLRDHVTNDVEILNQQSPCRVDHTPKKKNLSETA